MCELNVRTSFVSLKRMNENHKNNSTVLSLDLLSFLCKKIEMGTKKEKNNHFLSFQLIIQQQGLQRLCQCLH